MFLFPQLLSDALFELPEQKQSMKTDILKMEDGLKYKIHLAGFQKNNIKISLKNGQMSVTAEKTEEKGEYLHKETISDKCVRIFTVGAGVTEEDIHAEFKDGVLTINVRQKPEEDRKLIEIQ